MMMVAASGINPGDVIDGDPVTWAIYKPGHYVSVGFHGHMKHYLPHAVVQVIRTESR